MAKNSVLTNLPMNSLYLWINILTLAFPLILSFDKKVAFFKNWIYLIPAIILTALFFLIWDEWFTEMGIWGFNAKYITGYYYHSLPIEEVLFFFTVPYASIFIYECIRVYAKQSDFFENLYRWFSMFFFGISTTLLYWFNDHLYTAIVCIILSVILATHLIVIRRRYMSWFYFAYLVSLLPMLIVNGLLTSKPVVYYNQNEITGYFIGSIPVEDFLYNLILLAMCTGLYEWFKRLGHRFRLRPLKQSS